MVKNNDYLLKMSSKLCECEIKRDIDTLYYIYKDVLQKLSCVDNNEDKNHLDMLIVGVIQKAQKLKDIDQRCQTILYEMSSSLDVNCRLAVCGCVDDYSMFLQDTDQRVVTLAMIRYNFSKNYKDIEDDYKQQILFLTGLLESGLISVVKPYPESNTLVYKSNLFEMPRVDTFSMPYEDIFGGLEIGVQDDGFSTDAFRYITDLRVIASYILFLIHSDIIQVKIKEEQKEQILSRLQPKRFDVLE